ncbi:MAG: tetratricopeptide repeat protein [Verrucomicrobiota bacterium]|nr:tetratricopeptide repeat protein [Verrucomicrobiota bacterium]
MPFAHDIYEELKQADFADQIGYARYLCEEILEKDPDHGPTLIRYASNLIALAQYQDAAKALSRAESVVPRKWVHLVLAQHGHLLEHKGNFVDAQAKFLEAHEHDPDDATYLIYAGSVAFRCGDISGAEQFARKAIKCTEGCIDEAYFNLGGYLLSQKRYAEARDCYLQALAIDRDYRLAKARLTDVERILNYQVKQVNGGNR